MRSLIRIFNVHILINKDAKVLHADNEDFDQTARKLIWVFIGRTGQKVARLFKYIQNFIP